MLVRSKPRQERKRLWDQQITIHGDDMMLAQAIMPRHVEQEIIAATREGNRWLIDNLSLPLEKYGYPL